MTNQRNASPVVTVALIMMISLHGIMLMALFAGVEPHPPARVTPFGMAPFLAVVIGLSVVGIYLNSLGQAGAVYVAVAVAVLSLLSFGPQKYLDPAISQVWVAVVAAQVSAVLIVMELVQQIMGRNDAAD